MSHCISSPEPERTANGAGLANSKPTPSNLHLLEVLESFQTVPPPGDHVIKQVNPGASGGHCVWTTGPAESSCHAYLASLFTRCFFIEKDWNVLNGYYRNSSLQLRRKPMLYALGKSGKLFVLDCPFRWTQHAFLTLPATRCFPWKLHWFFSNQCGLNPSQHFTNIYQC